VANDGATVLTQGSTTDNQEGAGAEQKAPAGDGGQQQESKKEQAAPADWRAGLSEELRGEKMFENIKAKDAAEALPILAKGYRDAQKMVGNALTRLPAKDAKPEDVAAWKQANLGKLAEAGLVELPPESVEKYTAKLDVAGRTVDEAKFKGALGKFHELGLSDRQAQGVLDLFAAESASARETLGTSAKETLKALETEWGGALGHNLDLGHRAVLEVGGQELMEVLDQTGLGNHPALIKAFVRVGGILSEDNPVFAETVKGGVPEAKTKLAAILNDRKHPYWSTNNDKAHKEAVAEVTRLQELVHAG
jgi:hypothetical protein